MLRKSKSPLEWVIEGCQSQGRRERNHTKNRESRSCIEIYRFRLFPKYTVYEWLLFCDNLSPFNRQQGCSVRAKELRLELFMESRYWENIQIWLQKYYVLSVWIYRVFYVRLKITIACEGLHCKGVFFCFLFFKEKLWMPLTGSPLFLQHR